MGIIKMTNYRQLQKQAMELGIKANQSEVVLQQLIAEALSNNTQSEMEMEDMEYEMIMNSASEASALELSQNTLPEVRAGLPASSTLQPQLPEGVVFTNKGPQDYGMDSWQICRGCNTNHVDIVDPSVCCLYCEDCYQTHMKADRFLTTVNTLPAHAIRYEGGVLVSDTHPGYDTDGDNARFFYDPKVVQPQVKLFEFIRADNTVVVFKHKGVQTTVGWSKKDFRCYSYKVGSAPKLMMIQTAINVFKHFKNGRDGDVAKIVKALTHLRNKPSIISAMENKLKAERTGESQRQKENASVTKTRRSSAVVIDPEWLKGYQQQQGENYDARNVRGAYDEYVANASAHSAS